VKDEEDNTVIVTATRRATSMQETAISMDAVFGSELEEKGYSSIDQFIDQVPGITAISGGGAFGNRIIIRNVATSTQESGSPVIATYFDDFTVSGMRSGSNALRLVDMERVEVLKGPQGTLFGRSAMGGIVRYISNKAQTDSVEGGFNTYLSNTADGGDNYGGHAFLNLPISETLAVRFVGYNYQNSGVIDNVELGDKDYNYYYTQCGRIAVHWDSTDFFSVDF
jgi:iron complex outermembrane receptor protein